MTRIGIFLGTGLMAALSWGCASSEALAEGASFPTSGGENQQPSEPASGANRVSAQQVESADAPLDPSVGTGPDVPIGVSADEYADTDPSALTEFRPVLAPYGSWADDATYGTVWVPSREVVGEGFAPYVTAGHWTYTNEWVWVSDYDWGWVPFHYGRWVYIAGRGWAWIPGRVYSGAWVTWRVGYGGSMYVGWAPLPPTWYWYGGYAYGVYAVPPAAYVFCHSRDVFRPVVAGHVVTGSQVPGVAAGTRPFVPASPSVNERVPASPTVNPRVAASPRVNGPPPSQIRINPDQVVPVPPNNNGLRRASEFAKPSTAVAAGARPPQAVTRSAVVHGASTPNNALGSIAESRIAPTVPSTRYVHPDGRTFTPPTTFPPAYRSEAPYVPPTSRPAPSYAPYIDPNSGSQRYSGTYPPSASSVPSPSRIPSHTIPPSTQWAPPRYTPPSAGYSPPVTQRPIPTPTPRPSYSPPVHIAPSFSTPSPAPHYSAPSMPAPRISPAPHYSPPVSTPHIAPRVSPPPSVAPRPSVRVAPSRR